MRFCLLRVFDDGLNKKLRSRLLVLRFRKEFCCENKLRSEITNNRVILIIVNYNYNYDNNRI